MAGKRLSIKAIDWAKIAERVPEGDKSKFLAFRGKSDSYLRRMLANPENPPKIDWSLYKKTVPIPGMVDTFQKQYESLEIPYPKDTASPMIDAQEQEIKKSIQNFKDGSNKLIQEFKSEANRINSLLPYEQMTMEDYYDTHPDTRFDPLNKPTYWPHTREEQLDYKPAEGSAPSH